MRVAVIGMGYVGLVTACGFASFGHNVLGIEKDPEKLIKLRQKVCPFYEEGLNELLNAMISKGFINFSSDLNSVNNFDIIFITVGTPSLPNGQVDLSQIYEVLHKLVNILKKPTTLVMKSTVPPGTGLKIRRRFLRNADTRIAYLSNPEFLREGNALKDWYHPDRIIIGGEDNKAIEQIKELYKDINAPKIVMGITSAEMVKYASNAFLATKISFINEIANLCEIVGADINEVAQAVGMDKRIGAEFLKAGLGYGGSCFPKDTKGLEYISLFNGHNFNLLKAVIEVNFKQRLKAVKKLISALQGVSGKCIAILGLAFKPGTDDVRESPALDIISLLLNEGAIIKAYDPLAIENALNILGNKVIFSSNPYECVKDSHAVILVTEWTEFLKLNWSTIKLQMRSPFVIFDGRNVLNKSQLISLGFQYYGIGR
ncbi:MAG: UDP-glucose/GDP-mannose dehydrogenase family protein [Thermosipho sp. (in: Bacteria)]|nr:UDP-glucose/GDP-mannose dehydrogenase family protein [Thermosipho sp. (in: thermotogales)]